MKGRISTPKGQIYWKPKRSYDPLDQDALLEEVSGATKQQPPWGISIRGD